MKIPSSQIGYICVKLTKPTSTLELAGNVAHVEMMRSSLGRGDLEGRLTSDQVK